MSLGKVDWSELPSPIDDGGSDHLTSTTMPPVSLPATNGSRIDVSALSGISVIYIYPMTGRPDTPLPDGWDTIPGARGCTPQSCAFRDHLKELGKHGVNQLFGLSTQSTAYQQEAVERLHLPYALLSDEQLELQRALRLPTMTVDDVTLLKRLTLIIENNRITKVFYPVFPPDENAISVIDWLENSRV